MCSSDLNDVNNFTTSKGEGKYFETDLCKVNDYDISPIYQLIKNSLPNNGNAHDVVYAPVEHYIEEFLDKCIKYIDFISFKGHGVMKYSDGDIREYGVGMWSCDTIDDASALFKQEKESGKITILNRIYKSVDLKSLEVRYHFRYIGIENPKLKRDIKIDQILEENE